MQRFDAPFAGDETSTLNGYLEYQRATFLGKCEGLTDAQLRQASPPSTLTLAGLLKHLTLVEESWFAERFCGADSVEPWSLIDWTTDPDWEFRTALDDSGDELRSRYAEACERSRAVVAATPDLGQLSAVPLRTGELFSLRWLLGHMIEETARHCGHADFISEAVDGVTGE